MGITRAQPFNSNITQNGKAKVVIQDIESYEQTQQTIALLKILSLGVRQIEESKGVIADIEMIRIYGTHKRKETSLHS